MNFIVDSLEKFELLEVLWKILELSCELEMH
jgi:hypothetical protein